MASTKNCKRRIKIYLQNTSSQLEILMLEVENQSPTKNKVVTGVYGHGRRSCTLTTASFGSARLEGYTASVADPAVLYFRF
ncbi:hypothetical protein EVAR_11138_1 [Eumeta japonica]|uniref:Uncharacterized protein n=1 Tax=Eumeta variegata TaxID=151549 RepID=A0A4C1U4Q8_EUMVA|nr:hypothetical protein EVAR_11138_1 [Eumeta japonica]